MSRNGSGTYTLPSGNPVVTGTTISSTWANNTLNDIATALTNSIAKDGQTTPTANLPMGTFKLTGMGVGAANTDSITLGQAQNQGYTLIGGIAGTNTITGSLSPTITAYVAGQKFSFVSAGANTGATTLNINSLGAKSITKLGTTALTAGDIPSGAIVCVEYDGTQFQLCNLVSQHAATADTATSATSATNATNATSATTATNLAGGGAGQVPYQSAAGTTAMLAAGTSGQALLSAGAAPPTWGQASAINYQAFTTTGANTWTKPSGTTASTRVLVEAWGGGGGGSVASGGGGGGGAYMAGWFMASQLGATETATVGAGGAAGGGTPGGTSTFGSWVTAYGGGGGSGASPLGGGGGGGLSAGSNTGTGGTGFTTQDAGGAGGSSAPGSTAGWGGGGGGGNAVGANGGKSMYGGGGGGVNTGIGGTSIFGGNGGAANTAGTAPGGGSGGGASTPAGARGEIRVTVFF